MSKSEFAQAYTERMFPDIAAPAGYIDPCLLYTSGTGLYSRRPYWKLSNAIIERHPRWYYRYGYGILYGKRGAVLLYSCRYYAMAHYGYGTYCSAVDDT